MDLNQRRPAPAAPEPVKKRLFAVRLEPPAADEPQVFNGGEALPESEGFNTPMPVSAEEREALEREGYADEQDKIVGVGLVDKGFTNERPELPYDVPSREQLANAQYEAHPTLIPHGVPEDYFDKNWPAAPEQQDEYYLRDCPLPTCGAVIRVPKDGDEGDVLGIGMSMRAATQLEELLIDHLEEHSLGEWMAALKHYQDQQAPARPAPTAGVVYPTETGITPGPRQRDPLRAAAVAALDARLGGNRAPATPQDAAERDAQLRARRAARREQQAKTSPYDLSPRYSPDLPAGTVGIKY